MKATGIVIIIIGVIMTVYTTFTFFTREKVLEIGQVEITKDKAHNFAWSPVIGIVVIGLGGVVLWQASKK
jgi:hypothetical protein